MCNNIYSVSETEDLDLGTRIFLLLTAAVVALGCQAATAATKQPKTDLDECVASARVWDITVKNQLASFMGVSLDRMPALFCQRIAEGVRQGRISYSDLDRLQFDRPTEIWLVLKGKSKATAAAQVPARRQSKYRICNGTGGTFQVPASEQCPLSGYAAR